MCTGGGDYGECRDACAAEPPDAPDASTPPPPPEPGAPGEPPGSEPAVPPLPASCPPIATGTVRVLGQDVRLFVGARRPGTRGPMMFYWHGTGSSASETTFGLAGAMDEILAEGGVVASFTTTTGSGRSTGNNVWFTGDFAMADILLACAIAQQDVDPRRVYTAGCSAGGLQAGAMAYDRSGYSPVRCRTRAASSAPSRRRMQRTSPRSSPPTAGRATPSS